MFWSITAWIATSAVILATAPKTDAEFVFTVFTNETGWPDGVAWMLGLLQSAVFCLEPLIDKILPLTLFAVCISLVLEGVSRCTFFSRCGPQLNRKSLFLTINCSLSLIGYDAITHMTEEMPRPTRDAPIAMLMCVAIGGVT